MKQLIVLALTACVALTAGCRSNRLVFATQTSIGMDVSGTSEMPNHVSFSFDRYEAAIVPRKTNGEAHSVFGGMDADMRWFGPHTIKQTFATGDAAKIATMAETTPLPATKAPNDTSALIFYTGTTYGLNLSAGEQAMPPNLLLGYRRTEAAVIPVPDPGQEVRSVYADIVIDSSKSSDHASTNFSKLGGVRIVQSFATGAAANALAQTRAVRDKLAGAAQLDPQIREQMLNKERKRAFILQKVASNGTVDAALLEKILKGDDGAFLTGTDTWVADFGGQPAARLDGKLVKAGNFHLDTLHQRAEKLP